MKPLTVFSTFDGMSCGRVALERAGITVGRYYASEIDKYAIRVSTKNYPDIVQLGDICAIHVNQIGYICVGDLEYVHCTAIDVFLGGSPCQGFSFAGKQLNFEDPRSILFFEYLRLLNAVRKWNPSVVFLLENVRMKKESEKVITECLGVDPIEINSALLSAQNRKRLYWTNLKNIKQPLDKGILLKDIVISGKPLRDKSQCILATIHKENAKSMVQRSKWGYLVLSNKELNYMDRQVSGGRTHWDFKHHSDVSNPKSSAIVANFQKGVPYNVLKDFDCIRKFHPIECERLQTLNDNYTEGVSATQRYKMIGNGWNIDTIAFLFKNLYIEDLT